MLETQTFRLVFVGAGRGMGVGPAERVDKTLTYERKEVRIARESFRRSRR